MIKVFKEGSEIVVVEYIAKLDSDPPVEAHYMSLTENEAKELLQQLQQVMNETPYTKLLENV
jgi:hypothetical protein